MLWRNAPAKLAPAETVRAFYAHVQAMLWRNAPAKLAQAETVRAFYATVLVIHAPAETVRANGAMLRLSEPHPIRALLGMQYYFMDLYCR